MKPDKSPSSALSRRQVFAGAGAVGALAAAAAVVHAPAVPEVQAQADTSPEVDDQGYRLTEHIKRYYQTARV